MSEELKPCPFCGGEARWVEEHDRIGEPFGLVVDHGERCFIGSAMMADWDTITAAWNTRPALKDRDVVLEEAAKVAESCREANRAVTNEVANRIAKRIRKLKERV